MSEVKLSVGGRDYTIACAKGQEDHVIRLGETIDAKVRQLGDNISTQETHKLLFGALFLADELYEAKQAASSAGTDLAQQEPATQTSFLGDPDLAPALEQFADLLESCADKLEAKLVSS